MNRTALAALIAVTIPVAAVAGDHRPKDRDEHRPAPTAQLPAPPPPAPAYRVPAPPPPSPWQQVRGDDRREVARLERLQEQYRAVVHGWRPPKKVHRLEAEILAAIDGEIAEARAASPYAWRGAGPARRAELSRLVGLRADFASLMGRNGTRAVQRKAALLDEVTRIALADLRPSPAALAWSGHR
jgi:hypothetical protein